MKGRREEEKCGVKENLRKAICCGALKTNQSIKYNSQHNEEFGLNEGIKDAFYTAITK